jgi:hypothetical protein
MSDELIHLPPVAQPHPSWALVSLLKTPKAKEILEFFGIQSLGTGGLDRSVAINGRPDRACQGLVSVSASGPVGSLLSPW